MLLSSERPRKARAIQARTDLGTDPDRAARGSGHLATSETKERICKRICKPDASGQTETWETHKPRQDPLTSVCRGQRGDWTLAETAETRVVWLITQRRYGSRKPYSRQARDDYVACVRRAPQRVNSALAGAHPVARQGSRQFLLGGAR